jgi:hypothetical protein
MAKTDNLIHYLSDIANAIREKEGSTDPINAQDFSEKIKSMSGGSNDGFCDYYYLDVTNAEYKEGVLLFAETVGALSVYFPHIMPL